MATIRTEDASDRLHLSLLSSPKDHDSPSTGVYTYNEDALGQGTWIVIINTGYNWEQFPREFGRPGEYRPIVVWNVPEDVRNATLEEDEIAGGLHWPPDDNTDYGEPFDGVPEGHGTQTAILVGGMRTGVARRAGLYLIKAGGAILDADKNVVEEDVYAQSLVIALHHVVEKLKDGTLPQGKTVIVIDTLWDIENMQTNGEDREVMYKEWRDQVEHALDELDTLGVVISVSAGNEGKHDPPGKTGDFMPNILVSREGSPLVIVGAVTSQGQLARISSSASHEVPITCYAMGKDILLPDLSVEHDTLQSGTTFSAAIAGGQAACMLSDPVFSEMLQWSSQDPKGNTVASRLKNLISEEGVGSFQRVRRDQMLDPASTWGGYPIPERLNVVCNSCAITPKKGRKRNSLS